MSGSGKTKERMLLTVKAIEALKPEAEPYRVPDMRVSALFHSRPIKAIWHAQRPRKLWLNSGLPKQPW